MPKFAVIEGNTIINYIVADSKEDAEQLTKRECIEYGESFPFGVGAVFDGEKWGYPEPTEPTEETGEVDA